MHPVKMRLRTVRDEKLTPPSVAPRMSHGKRPAQVLMSLPVALTLYAIPRPPRACAVRAAALDDEIFKHPVKGEIFVKARTRELGEIAHRLGRGVIKKPQAHHALFGVDAGEIILRDLSCVYGF